METLNIIDDSGDEYIEHAEFEDVTGIPETESQEAPYVFKVTSIDTSYFYKKHNSGDGVGDAQSYRTGSLLSTLMDYLNNNEISLNDDDRGAVRGPQEENTGQEYEHKDAELYETLKRIRWNI